MTEPQSPVLEVPAMLHGSIGTIRRKVKARSQVWAREYLKTGAFTLPRRMLLVPPGESLVMHAAAELEFMDRPSWRIHMFIDAFTHLDEGVPTEQRRRMEEAFESFCLSTPWGALYHAVSPPPPWSAARMAKRISALLRFWDLLAGPRYAYRVPDTHYRLDALMAYIYGQTLDAWCPEGSSSMREHLTLAVDRMAKATREDCTEALLRLMPVLVKSDAEFKHRESLSDPVFLRESISALSAKDFDGISSAYKYTVTTQLAAWDRRLGR